MEALTREEIREWLMKTFKKDAFDRHWKDYLVRCNKRRDDGTETLYFVAEFDTRQEAEDYIKTRKPLPGEEYDIIDNTWLNPTRVLDPEELFTAIQVQLGYDSRWKSWMRAENRIRYGTPDKEIDICSINTWRRKNEGDPLEQGYKICADDSGYELPQNSRPKKDAILIIRRVFTDDEIDIRDFVYEPPKKPQDTVTVYYKVNLYKR